MSDYQQVLEFLYAQLPMYQREGKVAFKKDLTNTRKLCEGLANPQEKFRAIHVAGTNGKGTTAHLIASVLQSAGYTVGLYTSPHLKSFRERIRINGQEITEDFVVQFVRQHQALIRAIAPSFFEMTVAMGWTYFAQENVDLAVIETGLGGRLDSTNIITPILSIITSISYDHQDLLGETLTEIAREKAGIIKPHVPIVVGRLPEEALSVMTQKAKDQQATLVSAHDSTTPPPTSDLFPLALKLNYATVESAVGQLRQQGLSIPQEAFAQGVAQVAAQTGLKGRWQTLRTQPRVVCDVGHNEEALARLMTEIKKVKYKNLHMVWGSVADKSIACLLPLMPRAATYYFCAPQVPRAMEVHHLARQFTAYGLAGKAYDSVDEAYRCALSQARSDDFIFVGGSTFVVAELADV